MCMKSCYWIQNVILDYFHIKAFLFDITCISQASIVSEKMV